MVVSTPIARFTGSAVAVEKTGPLCCRRVSFRKPQTRFSVISLYFGYAGVIFATGSLEQALGLNRFQQWVEAVF